MSIQYNSNVSVIVRGVSDKLRTLGENPDAMLRTVALTVLPEIKKRVHVDGKDSAGSQIGTYSPGYMKVRTGKFKNADLFKRGAKKGKNKNSGTFTGNSSDEKVGTARPNYNRSDDTKVVLSLTRQMENDMSVLPSGTGYGIGYNNPDNFKKSQYNEETYKKDIWKLTEGERKLAVQTAQQFTDDYLKS